MTEIAARMTEAEWLASHKPFWMLNYLRGRVSDRKMRLFACACCRRIWHLLKEEKLRQRVEIAERAAEGLVSPEELARVRGKSRIILLPHRTAARETGDADALVAASQAAYYTMVAVGKEALKRRGRKATVKKRRALVDTARAAEQDAQAALLRDIVGNPFCAAGLAGLAALEDRTARELARTIYDERAFDRLPILADALEDVGCDHADILDHCRQPGEHVRGCWVIDLLLGKA